MGFSRSLAWGAAGMLALLLVSTRAATPERPAPAPAPAKSDSPELSDAKALVRNWHDEVKFREFTSRVQADPWMVCESLLALDRPDVAAAFANAVSPKPDSAIATYASSQRSLPDRFAKFAAVQRLMAAKEYRRLLADDNDLGDWRNARETVSDIRRVHAIALALKSLSLDGEAAQAFHAAAEAARSIGWSSRPRELALQAYLAAARTDDVPLTLQTSASLTKTARSTQEPSLLASAMAYRGLALEAAERYLEARQSFDAARSLLDKTTAPRAWIAASLGAARVLVRMELPREALGRLRAASELAESNAIPDLSIRCRYWLARCELTLGAFDAARQVAQSVSEAYRARRCTPAQLSGALELLGEAQLRLNAPKQAIAPLREAVDIRLANDHYAGAIRALDLLTSALESCDKIQAAVHTRGLAASMRQRGREWVEYSASYRAYQLALGQGYLIRREGDWSRALSLYEIAIERALDIGSSPLLARALSNKGNVLSRIGRLGEALIAYESALFKLDRSGSGAVRADIHQNLATTYLHLGKIAQALRSSQHAIDLYGLLCDRRRLVPALTTAATVQLHGMMSMVPKTRFASLLALRAKRKTCEDSP